MEKASFVTTVLVLPQIIFAAVFLPPTAPDFGDVEKRESGTSQKMFVTNLGLITYVGFGIDIPWTPFGEFRGDI